MSTRPTESSTLHNALLAFPETYAPSPRHALDPCVAVQNMMGTRVAVDFFKLHESNRLDRFLAIEADTTGESSDCGDTVLYGLYWSAEQECWWPAYRNLRELDDHAYIILPCYGNTPTPRSDRVIDAVTFLSKRGVDMYS